MNELILDGDIQFRPAEIQFPRFEELKTHALELAGRIAVVEVTEENVKAVKKDLAQVRKLTTELNNRRKLIKAEILKDYNTFEAQIKEIDGIISEAEETVREQVRVIDEAERDRKHDAIREIWDKRIGQYSIAAYGDYFERWLQPSHLNKSTSMKSVEDDMVRWLEDRQRDIFTLQSMDEEYLVEYIDSLDLAGSIVAVNHRHEIRSVMTEDEDTEDTATFIVTGKKDIKLTESLLTENEIEYRRIK